MYIIEWNIIVLNYSSCIPSVVETNYVTQSSQSILDKNTAMLSHTNFCIIIYYTVFTFRISNFKINQSKQLFINVKLSYNFAIKIKH